MLKKHARGRGRVIQSEGDAKERERERRNEGLTASAIFPTTHSGMVRCNSS